MRFPKHSVFDDFKLLICLIINDTYWYGVPQTCCVFEGAVIYFLLLIRIDTYWYFLIRFWYFFDTFWYLCPKYWYATPHWYVLIRIDTFWYAWQQWASQFLGNAWLLKPMSYHKQHVLGIMLQVKLVGNTSQNVQAPVLSVVDPVPKNQEYFQKTSRFYFSHIGVPR